MKNFKQYLIEVQEMSKTDSSIFETLKETLKEVIKKNSDTFDEILDIKTSKKGLERGAKNSEKLDTLTESELVSVLNSFWHQVSGVDREKLGEDLEEFKSKFLGKEDSLKNFLKQVTT